MRGLVTHPPDRTRLARPGPLLGVTAAFLLAGCGPSFNARYLFRPRPASTHVAGPGKEGEVHALVTVLGVRERKEKPTVVDVRFRLENRTEKPARLDPAKMALHAADLARFSDPRAEPSGPVKVGPGDEKTVDVHFPFPEEQGTVDLTGLTLRWTVEVGKRSHTRSNTFRRDVRDRFRALSGDPYPYGYRPFGFRAVFHHHH